MKHLMLALLILNTALATEIPVIGATKDSRYIYGNMTEKAYVEQLIQLKTGIDSQLMNSLRLEETKSTGMKLKKISVGLGVSGEIGIGPYKFGKALKQRFVYGR